MSKLADWWSDYQVPVVALALIFGGTWFLFIWLRPKPATGYTGSSNPQVKVETLFTDQDGYTVKRFYDGGGIRYYVTPGPARMEYSIQQGKASVPQSIPTAGR